MFALRSLLAIAPLAALAYAQSRVAFTSFPTTLSGGDSFNITWSGGDGSPVTLTLRRGNPDDLNTVTTIASNVDGYWYNWNVPQTLSTGTDYAFQINQGSSDPNWTGLFSIQGSASASNATTSAPIASRTGNSTMSITSLVGTAASVGTGSPMQRNTTFSSASLTASSSDGPFTFGSSTSSRTSSRTASASSSSTSAPSNDASTMAGSSAALIMGLVAAMMLH